MDDASVDDALRDGTGPATSALALAPVRGTALAPCAICGRSRQPGSSMQLTAQGMPVCLLCAHDLATTDARPLLAVAARAGVGVIHVHDVSPLGCPPSAAFAPILRKRAVGVLSRSLDIAGLRHLADAAASRA
ncbi:MAG: hypothetical protein AAF772_20610 [Acidobacteriota bacterium]